MKSVLIIYATRYGQTAKVATRIAGHLKSLNADVDLVNAQGLSEAQDPDINAFDLLVFGASMHAGGLESEILDFINRHADRIEHKPRSFFLVLLSAATKDPALRADWLENARNKMSEQLQVDFDDVEMIAGALTYSKYPLPIKWVMKHIAKKAGENTDTSRDYEYTEWEQVERYAERLAMPGPFSS